MGTTTQKLQKLVETKNAIKTAIINKGVSITNEPFDEYPSKITAIQTGSSADDNPENKEIQFYDWDGTLLFGYNYDELADLTELPSPTTDWSSESIVFQEWNWTLAELIERGTGDVLVGAIYNTSDGATNIYIQVDSAENSTFNISLKSDTGNLTIYFGDGTSQAITTGVKDITHNYVAYRKYLVKIKTNIRKTGTFYFNGPSTTTNTFGNNTNTAHNICYKIHCGTNCLGISGMSCFAYSPSLLDITFSNTCTTFGTDCTFGQGLTFSKSGIKNVIFPNKPIVFGDNYGTFTSCYNLDLVIIGCKTTSNFKSDFFSNATIKKFSYGEAFCYSYNTFKYCYCLEKICWNRNSDYATSNHCFEYSRIDCLEISDLATVIKEFFCYQSIIRKVVLGSCLTTIQTNAFYDNVNCIEYDFTKCTAVPTLAGINAFTGINPTCKIKVPQALYNDWIIATNWVSLSSYIVGV